MKLTDKLGKELLIFDGGTGTVLQSMGLMPGELPDTWNLSRPDDIYALHRAYLDAGADIVNTNTFVTTRLKHENAALLAEAAAKTARRAVNDAGHGYVAFDVGPTGKLMSDIDFCHVIELYREVIAAGAPYSDLIMIETMSDLYEAKAAVIAAKEVCELPIFVTVTMDKNHRTLSGADPETVAATLEGLGVSALGLNCGVGPDTMEEILPELIKYTDLPIIITPNAGLPITDGEHTHYDVTPDGFADAIKRIILSGAAVVGGCCGTTPEHIKRVNEVCRKLSLTAREKRKFTRVTSGTKTVNFGEKTVIIGERINPTGKPKLKAALRNSDFDYILDMAYSELDAGADVLDVNCGLPDIDECQTLLRAVNEIQNSVPLPLCIDTSNAEAMESAMRIYNGIPIVNSVSGKAETMDKVFPLVKKYGGAVVALMLDDSGIPDTADGRLAIAERIIRRAEEYGIPRHRLIFDALTMAAATVKGAASVTLECVRRCREELGCYTVLGVSNISFGLPARETVSSAFLTSALHIGLSAAIMNPESAAMTAAVDAHELLFGADAGGALYSEKYANAEITQAKTEIKKSFSDTKAVNTVSDAILLGRKNDAARLAGELLTSLLPMEVINGHIIPGLSRLGEQYDKNRIFLPQLLSGSEAATAAFEAVRSQIPGDAPNKATVVLATVEGDIHDIGKNIVRALLENYGYDVHDLGRDVKPSTVVEEVVRTHAPLLGLSALMTTTVPAMKRTVEAVRAAAPWCKIMVGGAVLTEELARMIGADFYSPEATYSVKIAEEIC